MTYANPWAVLGPSLAGVFLIVLAIEMVLGLVRSALSADTGGSAGDL